MNVICKTCELLLDESELVPIYDRVPYGEGYVAMPSGSTCPHCGGTDIHDAVSCACCNEPVIEDELVDDVCPRCANQLRQMMNELWLKMPIEPWVREWAINHADEWMV